MMAVGLTGSGADLQAGRPQALFEVQFAKGSIDAADYDVTPDGQRFLMVQSDQQSSGSTMFHVLIHWVGGAGSTLPLGPADARASLRRGLFDRGVIVMESAGPFAWLTASMSASTVVSLGSYVTIASWPSSATCARETPFTASSADRTALMQPSQIMPSTVSVTVESRRLCPLWPGASLRRQSTSVAIPIAASSSRLVISVFMFSFA